MRPIALLGTPWMSLASFVTVLWMISLTVCGDTLGTSSNSDVELPSKNPCPDPEVIAPCACTFAADFGMDMDCSSVASEDELRRVFSNDFNFTDFWSFNIFYNYNISSLREGDLGSASFALINIGSTSLAEIEDGALTGSLHTLITLDIGFNNLTSVPDISAFTSLKYLKAHGNQITRFPTPGPATLVHLDLRINQIDDAPEDALMNMTSLEWLSLRLNSLTEIRPHTFTQNENLNTLDLSSNLLTTIPDDAITLHGQQTLLDLFGNQITSLTYEAVSSVNKWLTVFANNLTEVPEKVFRPLLEDFVVVEMYENPFKCGCDMAWLVLNQTLLNRIADLDRTNCADGKHFTDLDPEVFKVMCPNATAVPL